MSVSVTAGTEQSQVIEVIVEFVGHPCTLNMVDMKIPSTVAAVFAFTTSLLYDLATDICRRRGKLLNALTRDTQPFRNLSIGQPVEAQSEGFCPVAHERIFPQQLARVKPLVVKILADMFASALEGGLTYLDARA